MNPFGKNRVEYYLVIGNSIYIGCHKLKKRFRFFVWLLGMEIIDSKELERRNK